MSPPAAARLPWNAVGALSVTQIVAWGSQYYAIAVLAPAIAAAEGWSREAIFGAYSLGLLAQGFAAFPAGTLIDRFGGRVVMSAGSLLSALALAGVALAPNPWWFGLAWIITGIAMAATQYEPAFATITASFGADARRAITYVTFAGGLASTVAWPVTAALLPSLGWRGAYAFWAVVTLVACLPLHLLLLPRARGGATRPKPRAMGPVLRSPAFWMVALALTAGALLFSVVGVHAIPMLQDAGLSATEAVTIASFTGVFQVAGRVLELAGLSRLRPTRVAILSALFQPLAIAALMAVGAVPGAAWAYVALYGLSAGILTIVRGTVPAELFGREGYGAVAGAMVAPGIMARAAGPYAAAWMWQNLGGYGPVQWSIMVAGIIACIAFIAAAALAPKPGAAAEGGT
ncbi:MFS transporter [Elioraea sp.]|uniref:MFS transporter n=1 Tax=Elioraea sp. TaxID=2185103 RepID=UPI0025C4F5A3|nr:MFS transporter [Elioraea sp.]